MLNKIQNKNNKSSGQTQIANETRDIVKRTHG